MTVMFDESQIAAAIEQPPADTRAWFRGTCMRRFTDQVAAASWDSVIFDLGPETPLRRITTSDARKGTKALTEQLFEQHHDPLALVTAIERGVG
jgi:proteasome accessory factor A